MNTHTKLRQIADQTYRQLDLPRRTEVKDRAKILEVLEQVYEVGVQSAKVRPKRKP